MKNIKKFASLLLAMLTAFSLAVTAGCGGGGEASSTPSESSTPNDSSSEEPSTPEGYSEWECTKVPTCTEDGKKERTNLANNQKEEKVIPARGHEYASHTTDINSVATAIGKCVRCGQDPTLPTLPQDQNFTVAPINSKNAGNMKDNPRVPNPVDLTEGCYSLEIPSNGEYWVAFSAETIGQFAFYSVGNTTATVARYSCASIGIMPCYLQAEGKVVDNNFYSYVNYSAVEEGEYWRAVFCINGTAGDIVKVCFTRIADPSWEPQNVDTMVYAKEINGKKADEPANGKELVPVDYEENYFFDEETGYYRMGTKANPGEIIYAAITGTATRMFEGSTFSTILQGIGSALNVQDGYTADGDYNILCYIPFISNCADDNDPNNGKKDSSKNCYMNFVNSDGVYPVTRELYKFLNVYVRSHPPIDDEIDDDDFNAEKKRAWSEHKNENGNDTNRNKYWLAPCFYYGTRKVGTKDNPLLLEEGENTLTIAAADHFYATLPQDAVYKVTCSTASVKLYVGALQLSSPIDFTIQGGATLRFGLGYAGGEAKVTVTKIATDNAGVTLDTAKAVSTSTVTFKTTLVYSVDGTAEYYAYYKYTATSEGSLTVNLTDTDSATITVGSDSIDNDSSTTIPSMTTVSVTESEPVYIYVKTDALADITATLSIA